jgi:hypothetical protein
VLPIIVLPIIVLPIIVLPIRSSPPRISKFSALGAGKNSANGRRRSRAKMPTTWSCSWSQLLVRVHSRSSSKTHS